VYFEEDRDKKAEMKKTAEDKMTAFLENLSKIAEQNGGKYLVGKSFTWADFVVVHFITQLDDEVKSYTNYPSVISVFDNVLNEPKIKDWMEKRPITPY